MRNGQVGISVLIIFIAIVIVAAVAAQVYITTQNKLQQRALAVGDESEERVSRGTEFLDVLAIVNLSSQRIYGFEILVRPLSSSSGITADSIALEFISHNVSFYATPQVTYAGVFHNSTRTFSSLPVNLTTFNIDVEGIDNDTLQYGNASDLGLTSYANEFVFVLESSEGVYTVVNYSGQNGSYVQISNGSTDQLYGFAQVSGTTLSFANAIGTCSNSSIIHNTKFCFDEVKGDGDNYLDRGELWKLTYRISEPYHVAEAQKVRLAILINRGVVSSAEISTPRVLTEPYATVWP